MHRGNIAYALEPEAGLIFDKVVPDEQGEAGGEPLVIKCDQPVDPPVHKLLCLRGQRREH